MTVIEFYTVGQDQPIGTVEFRDGAIHASNPGLQEIVTGVWQRLGRDDAKATAFYRSWSNGYLTSKAL